MHRRTPLRMGPLRFRDPVLLCGVLYGLLLFDASGFLRTGLLAAFLHEWGHILVYCAQQRRFPVIEVTLTGFCMRLGRAELSPAQRFRLAAAGPAVNFALAGVWAVLLSRQATVQGSAFWAANLLTGAFNLLPIPPLDGAQMLASAAQLRAQKKSLSIIIKRTETQVSRLCVFSLLQPHRTEVRLTGKYRYLTFEDRKKIEAWHLLGDRPVDIAARLSVHHTTIYKELQRGATGALDANQREGYSAELAERRLRESFKRRGKRAPAAQ